MKPIELSSPVKVWYKALPKFSKIIWPILDVRLSHGDLVFSQPLLSLVDSGANFSILHPEVAEALGFYKSWILPEPVRVDIYGSNFSFKFSVIDNPGLIWPCILGEDSIFSVAKLDFQKFKGYFEVRFRKDLN